MRVLTFNADGSLFVQADCNTSHGTRELSGNQLTITLGATTLVAFELDSLSDHFLANLGKAAQAGSGFGNLVIVLADEAGEMYFHRTTVPEEATNLTPSAQEDIIDILWQWTNLVAPRPARPGASRLVNVVKGHLQYLHHQQRHTHSPTQPSTRLQSATQASRASTDPVPRSASHGCQPMLNHDVPVIVVSRRLGHARTSITLDVYGHLLPSMQAEAAELIDELVIPTELKLDHSKIIS